MHSTASHRVALHRARRALRRLIRLRLLKRAAPKSLSGQQSLHWVTYGSSQAKDNDLTSYICFPINPILIHEGIQCWRSSAASHQLRNEFSKPNELTDPTRFKVAAYASSTLSIYRLPLLLLRRLESSFRLLDRLFVFVFALHIAHSLMSIAIAIAQLQSVVERASGEILIGLSREPALGSR